MVFILGRMGNTKQALKLIIQKLQKVGVAVEFVEQQKDEELWEFLITECLGRPEFVSELLEHIGAHVDPIKLIRRIPEGMEIDNLRDRLVKIVSLVIISIFSVFLLPIPLFSLSLVLFIAP
jgi:vacuolar protein sorting-associated protein 41